MVCSCFHSGYTCAAGVEMHRSASLLALKGYEVLFKYDVEHEHALRLSARYHQGINPMAGLSSNPMRWTCELHLTVDC
jgi:hypothetical protein